MKVVLITPNFHQARGNTITVQRIAEKLTAGNVEVEIVSITENSTISSLPLADLYHGFNAFRFYKFKEQLQTNINDYVVTMTGTDLNHDLFNENHRHKVIAAVTEAKAVHVFNEEAKQLLLAETPAIAERIYVIPQDITKFNDELDVPSFKEESELLFILPAGIRRVKNVPFAIEGLAKLHPHYPFIRLLIVGPILEESEGETVTKLVKQNHSWVQYIGEIPHYKMGALYKQSDVILNTSYSEGQSTAIMEGMAYGLPVIASNNLGNRSLIVNEHIISDTGFHI